MSRALLLLLLLLLAAGCAGTGRQCPPLPWDAWGTVADVQELPQDPMFYAQRLGAWDAPEPLALKQARAEFLQRFFAPWDQEASGYEPEQALWAVAAYGGKQGYGENLRPRDAAWFDGLVALADKDAFPSMARKAVAVRNTALRSMPTHKPFFLDPRDAGEGYPFDYFQNSALWAGTPVFVSHASTDGAWLFAEAPFAAGWVPAQDLAWADEAVMQRCRQAPLAAVTRDGVALHGPDGQFLFTAHVGALLPMQQASPAAVLAPVRTPSGNAALLPCSLPADAAQAFPMELSPVAVATLARELLGQPYGWGGMYENRDCSAMTRDLLTPFGLWLPRNSKPQARSGRSLSLDGLAPEAREALLLREGVPFRTLVGQPGHVMLYLGEYQGRAMILHNIWGLRTEDDCGRTGRQIIGRAVITTLTPGTEIEAVRRSGYSLQKRIDTLAVLPAPAP